MREMLGLALLGLVQLWELTLSKILTKTRRFLPLLAVSFLEGGRDEYTPGFEESKEGNLFSKLTEMVQWMCSSYAKRKICLSLQAAALTVPRRKLPGQGFLNLSSSCFLPSQEFLLQSRLINSTLCTILHMGSRSTTPAAPSAALGASQTFLKSRSPPGAAPGVHRGCASGIANYWTLWAALLNSAALRAQKQLTLGCPTNIQASPELAVFQ